MNCRDIEPLIYLVREGELTERERDLLTEHIQTCRRCRELVLSTKAMVSLVSKADYDLETKGDDQFFPDQLPQNIRKAGRTYTFILIKAAAACLLFLLTFTFISQERSFYTKQSELQARLQSDDEGLSDCLKELRRKIHYHSMAAFARPDTMRVNLISEEELTTYVRENCGYNAGDIRILKKMLIQAGLID
jgi:hypothetical protein